MKRLFKLITSLLFVTLTGCDSGALFNEQSFGDFSYHGIFLKEYANKEINVEQAKSLVDISNPRKTRNRGVKEENVLLVLSKYGSLTTTVKYYVSDREEQQVRSDIYQGTDFKYLLENNHYEPFGQMNVKYIFIDDDLLDDLERQNYEFKNSNQYLTSPFNNPFTYHTNDNNTLILQTHHFAELPASVCGGIGSTFREDCELLFDEEGKITYWQSSLGLYTSTPTGTVREGYIFEVEFKWTEK